MHKQLTSDRPRRQAAPRPSPRLPAQARRELATWDDAWCFPDWPGEAEDLRAAARRDLLQASRQADRMEKAIASSPMPIVDAALATVLMDDVLRNLNMLAGLVTRRKGARRG